MTVVLAVRELHRQPALAVSQIHFHVRRIYLPMTKGANGIVLGLRRIQPDFFASPLRLAA